MPPLQPKAGHFGLILPLCTSSATVGLALLQYPMFHGFLSPTNPSIAGRPLSQYWGALSTSGVAVIAAPILTSTVAGLLSARWLTGHQTLETTDVSRWYMAGAALAAGHFAFVPAVAPLMRRMWGRGLEQEEGKGKGLNEGEIERGNRVDMRTWFVWHTVRTVLVDVPALWCFAEGAALSFWVI